MFGVLHRLDLSLNFNVPSEPLPHLVTQNVTATQCPSWVFNPVTRAVAIGAPDANCYTMDALVEDMTANYFWIKLIELKD